MYNCKYAKYCGGCVNLDKDYNLLLQNKTEYVSELFKPITNTKVKDCVGNYYPLKYRNKIHLAFTELKGKTLIGFFEEGSVRVVDIDSCLLFGDWASKLIAILREYVSRFKIRSYKDGVGIIRYAHARCIDNKLQLTLVATTDNFAGRKWLYHALSQVYADVSLYININRRTDRAVFDERFKFIDGNKYLEFDVLGVKVALTPSSFLQVNLPVATKMYKAAKELLDINSNTTVLDLYSGIGITSVYFSKFAKKVISIEEVLGAVNNAKNISRINGSNNIDIFCGKCEDVLEKLKMDNIDDLVIFVDPARAGLDRRVISKIIELNPRKIVYMSCNPNTCVEDCKQLVNDNIYIIEEISTWDMFPYAHDHVETLVSLKGNQ